MLSSKILRVCFASALVFSQLVHSMYLVYLTRQHNVVPEKHLVSEITHMAIAFMSPGAFNDHKIPESWPLFVSVEEVRSKFVEGVKVMVAIGGWGDTDGFSIAAATEGSRARFSRNIKAMVDATGADGVDIDWEYPGGNGEDYKTHPNSEKEWEIDAYPKLLSALRSELGTNVLISAAVPGLPRDMLAFTEKNIPRIDGSVDFFNVMTYDLMNRRDNVTKHHSGVAASIESIETYKNNGMKTEKMNLGFAFYLRWFKTDPSGNCEHNAVGCKTVLMEDPVTGEDLGKSGAFSWHDPIPQNLRVSFEKAIKQGIYDSELGGHYYWDSSENIWWTWESPNAIEQKFNVIMMSYPTRGVFAWALGEDGNDFIHLQALSGSYKNFRGTREKEEL